jgi:hypothetical protein
MEKNLDFQKINLLKIYRPDLVNNIFDEIIDTTYDYNNDEAFEERKKNIEILDKILKRLNLGDSFRVLESSTLYFKDKKIIKDLGNKISKIVFTITLKDFVKKYKDLESIEGLEQTEQSDYFLYLETCVRTNIKPNDLDKYKELEEVKE